MAKKTDPNTLTLAPATRDVILDTPGVLSCGPYVAGKVYTLAAAEAARLVAVKGFRYANETTPPEPAVPAEAAPE